MGFEIVRKNPIRKAGTIKRKVIKTKFPVTIKKPVKKVKTIRYVIEATSFTASKASHKYWDGNKFIINIKQSHLYPSNASATLKAKLLIKENACGVASSLRIIPVDF